MCRPIRHSALRALLALILAALWAPALASATAEDLKLAERLAVRFIGGDVEQVRLAFSPELAASLGAEELARQRAALLERGGSLRHVQAARAMAAPPGTAPPFVQAIVPVDLERIGVEVLVTWPRGGSARQLSGFSVRAATRREPTMASGPRGEIPFVAADYVDDRRILREPLRLGPDAFPVDGEYVRPRSATANARVPLVVMVPDRDCIGIDGRVGPSRPWKDIADGLASMGVATIRFERRMERYSEKATAPYRLEEELFLDVDAALRFAARTAEVDAGRVYLLGHGFGAWAAPALHQRAPRVRGLVLLSPPESYTARDRLDFLTRDAAALPGLSAMRGAVGYLEDRLLDPAHIVADAPAAFWYSLDGRDPLPLLAKGRAPVLVVMGGRDARSSDFHRAPWLDLARTRRGVALRYLAEADYWLMPPATETTALRHVQREAIDVIARFAQGGGK